MAASWTLPVATSAKPASAVAGPTQAEYFAAASARAAVAPAGEPAPIPVPATATTDAAKPNPPSTPRRKRHPFNRGIGLLLAASEPRRAAVTSSNYHRVPPG